MPKIIRKDPGAILSKVVEYHNFVYLQGVTAKDTTKDAADPRRERWSKFFAIATP